MGSHTARGEVRRRGRNMSIWFIVASVRVCGGKPWVFEFVLTSCFGSSCRFNFKFHVAHIIDIRYRLAGCGAGLGGGGGACVPWTIGASMDHDDDRLIASHHPHSIDRTRTRRVHATALKRAVYSQCDRSERWNSWYPLPSCTRTVTRRHRQQGHQSWASSPRSEILPRP